MLDLLLVPIAILYLLVVGALFSYGLNFLHMTWISWRERERVEVPPPPPAIWPSVTVQLPVFNELYVAERLVRAVSRLEYPGSLEIQVLDDSTDDTSPLLQGLVDGLKRSGLDIHYLHRENRRGFKAGALADGLRRARGEFLAFFDADSLPPPDFLLRTIPQFHEPRLAFVQTRWGHADRDYSFLTVLQSIAIDAHFKVEQFTRHRSGLWFNFNGSAGVWRRAAIEDAGGWSAETLTEDLDLSYRAFLRGWRAAYLDDVEVPAELPASFAAYRRQQHRWARGSFECAARILPPIWRSAAPWPIKLQATLHLTGYGVHLLLFALCLLYPMILWLADIYPGLITLFGLAVLFNATALAPTLYFWVGQRKLRPVGLRDLPRILLLSAMGAGMMLNTVRALGDILLGRSATFHRTPKYGLVEKGPSWHGRRYQLSLDPIVLAEGLLALLNIGVAVRALATANVFIALYAVLFAAGLGITSGISISQSIRVAGQRRLSRKLAPAA
jgi:cellulose synthase/poly-beta-1,6-N-acetylglucosamine synthase-like glycosyltransferase